jgi:lysozyme family protein
MADFSIAIKTVLANEGGLVDDYSDPGGLTNFGISQRSYPNIDIRNLTVEGATEIYHRDFWKFDGINDQDIATKLFDAFVNMGAAAIRLMQRLVNVTQDGQYGPMTEKAINQYDPGMLLIHYRESLCIYYQELVQKNPKLGKFLTGWLKRANQ